MKFIWAPWRIQYIEMKKPDGCIMCEKPRQYQDDHNYIVFRGEFNFIMLNLYPYNPGHLLIAPYKHVSNLDNLTNRELFEHWQLVRSGVEVLCQVFKPAGYNIGINLGRAAGAGIEEHIHTHIVPRWIGDANFMQVIADVKVIPQALADTYQRLKDKFSGITIAREV